MTTTSEIFSFEYGRVLTGREHCAIMGHDEIAEGDFNHRHLRSLAGECMHGGSLAMILIPFYANSHAPWWR